MKKFNMKIEGRVWLNKLRRRQPAMIALVGLLLLPLYQNCSKNGVLSSSDGGSGSSSSLGSPSSYSIKVLDVTTRKPTTLTNLVKGTTYNLELSGPNADSADVSWAAFDDGASCQILQYVSYGKYRAISCTDNGNVQVMATVVLDGQATTITLKQPIGTGVGKAPPPTLTPQQVYYVQYCGACHGQDPSTSTKRGRTAQQIQNAITGNAGGVMYNPLKNLTAQQIQDIASALK